MADFQSTAILGAGVIGASWAALFLASPRTGKAIYGANFVIDEGLAAGLFIAP